jgi:perosamine synthetase
VIDAKRRKVVLARGRSKAGWEGEPNLGGWYTEKEIKATVKAIHDSMDWRVGFGFITREITDFEKAFARYCGTKYAVSVATASIGLDMAMRCLDLKPGDEVICPAINFKASHMAILGQGGKTILCDVDPRTFNIDVADAESRITRRTRAILPVHMNGLSAPMDELRAMARRRSRPGRPVRVIGDAARACGGGYRGGKIGAKAWMTVFSFHTMKLMTTLGEGGMITTDDPKLARRLCDMRQWGGGSGWGSSYKLT